MSVIPASQLALMRKRRELIQSLHQQDWESVVALEAELFELIDVASIDDNRSASDLLKELGRLSGVYRQISQVCHNISLSSKSTLTTD